MQLESPTPGVVRLRRGLPLAALAAAALMSACGSKSSTSSAPKVSVDTAKVARSIEASIFAQRHLRSTVVCPVSEAAEAGKTFECVATTQSLKKPVHPVKTSFVVTVQNKRGGVTYIGK
jgi:hypothetical protein